ncbi:hypothetical protein [Bifidobacterium aerophilum]|nr:hypothetical protein [Bifidobacterium aerophilum]
MAESPEFRHFYSSRIVLAIAMVATVAENRPETATVAQKRAMAAVS